MDSIPGGSSTEDVILYTRKEVFVMVKEHLKDGLAASLEHLSAEISKKSGRSVPIRDDMKQSFSTLFHKMRTKWQSVNRHENDFYLKYGKWLNKHVSFPVPAPSQKTPGLTAAATRGRPSVEFESSSEKSKRRKTEEVSETLTTSELAYAAQMSLRSSGQLDAAEVVRNATLTSPTRALKYRKALETKPEVTLSAEAALSYLVDRKLSKSDYQALRSLSIGQHCRMVPPYSKVAEAKKLCYPPRTAITITENKAEVQLQALLDHTVQRIILLQREVISSIADENVKKMSLICKWGCDRSSGQSVYKQEFEDDSISDSSVFFTSVVPLQLVFVDCKSNAEIVIWKNPRPSSPRFCRPLRLQFLHENTESTVDEERYINDQIKALVPYETIINQNEISVEFKMLLTMIDGKVCNALTSTSSAQRCYLCGATSKDFNNIDALLQRKVDEENFKFGLSTLHGWIRFFECCLHLSYKLKIKKWQARTEEEKLIVQESKRVVQKGFRTQLGLIVDFPKPGFGSTNDGNTARRFFENSSVSAMITGVDEKLITRFYAILQAISSGHKINAEKFQDYAIETARLFVKLYPWYYMPTSVHKLLIHGPQIITRALLPIGQLSEDAQEARNKDIESIRENLSRKCSRSKTMEDVWNRLMVTSDPYISSIRKLPQKKLRSLSAEAVELLLPPSITSQSTAETDSEFDDEESDEEIVF